MIIGILGRPALTDLDNKGVLIYKSICEKIYDYGAIPIGITPTIHGMDFNKELTIFEYQKMEELISICDGIILQGGEDMNAYDVTLAQYLYEKDIPTLGICLGMQTMGVALSGSVVKVNYHNCKNKYAHYVKIKKNSKLYEIIGREYIYVNSRHNDKVYQTNLDKVAYFEDALEALEDKDKKFYVGIQWHPETLDDENCDKLFKAFLLACKKNTNNI